MVKITGFVWFGRVGNTADTRGTAFVIYEDIFDAKNACDHLSGFNVCNR
jgi:pre-mRNA branch site protein p14